MMILDPNGPSVAFQTLGCRLNFFETDGIFSGLKANGFRIAEQGETPNYFIVNTCTVTNNADRKNRSVIRQAIKNFPTAKVVVTGCYAQTDREVIENIPGVFRVLGNDQKSEIPTLLSQDFFQSDGLLGTDSGMTNDRFGYSNVLPEGHTRAFLKIQDGCNRKCSYCKIPQARGLGVSRSEKDVIDQIQFMQDQGVGEIQLTGVNLGWYRNDLGEKSFLPLLEKILKILDYSRIRLSSIEPPDVGGDLAELMTHPRFCKFLHVPLQSGSREILRSMQRTYHPDSFRLRIQKVKEKLPQIFLGTDLILGFPGEGKTEFQDSMDLVQELGFAKIHAFPYSVRKGTKAESKGDTVPPEVKKERVARIRSLSRELHQSYALTQIQSKEEAILESDGTLVTGNYLKGKINTEHQVPLRVGQFVEVTVDSYETSAFEEGRFGFRIASSSTIQR